MYLQSFKITDSFFRIIIFLTDYSLKQIYHDQYMSELKSSKLKFLCYLTNLTLNCTNC